MRSKKKLLTSAVALGTAAVLALGGTFAWQSINQTALNEASDIVNPGGRLHNDLYYVDAKTTDSNVYVENFADDEIFARVRLEEYMEVVMNYGTAAERVEIVTGEKALKDGVTDVSADGATQKDQFDYTYTVHKFGEDAENAAAAYFQWAVGTADSAAVYMPTFNVNKDSLAADIHGLYADRVGGISSRSEDQYTESPWTVDDEKTGNEIYDADYNSVDELNALTVEELNALIDNGTGAEAFADNINLKDATHTAAAVGSTRGLISMDEWLTRSENDEETDRYWVYDEDGWVYWSSPIAAHSTTGLLLDSFTLDHVMDDTWYYAVNVVGQFVTANDVGKRDGTGFYAVESEKPTAAAETLLDIIGVDMSGDGGAGAGGGSGEDDPWTPGALLFSLTQRGVEDAHPYSYYDVSATESFLYDLPSDQDNVFDVTVGDGVTLSVSFENTVSGTSYENNVLTLAAGDPSTITVQAVYEGDTYTINITPVYSDIIITSGDTAETKFYKIPNGAYNLSAVGFEGDVSYAVSEEAMRSRIDEEDGAKLLTMGGYESAEAYTITASDTNGNSGTVKILPQDMHSFDGALFWLYQDYGEYGLHGIGQLIDTQTYYWSSDTKYVVSVDLPIRPTANFTWTLTDAAGETVSSDKINFYMDGSSPTLECGAGLTAADTFTLKGVSDVELPSDNSGGTTTEYTFYLNFGEEPESGEDDTEDEWNRYLTLYESEGDAEYVRMTTGHTLMLDAEIDLSSISVDIISWGEEDEKITTSLTENTDYIYDADTQALQFKDTEAVTAAITGAQEIKVSSGGYFGYVDLISRNAYAVDRIELAWTSDKDAAGAFTSNSDNELTYTVGANDKETVTLTPTATLYDANGNEIETDYTVVFCWGNYTSDVYGVYDDCYVTRTDEYNEDNTAGDPEVLYIVKTDDTKIQIHTAKVTEPMEIPFEVDIKVDGHYVDTTVYGTLSIQPNA